MTGDEIFKHLIDVEREAASLVSDAEHEAERRVLEARRLRDESVKTALEKKARELDLFHEGESRRLREDHAVTLEAYRSALASSRRDPERLASYLEDVFSGES